MQVYFVVRVVYDVVVKKVHIRYYITSPDEFLVVFSDENVVIAGPARPSGRRLSVTFVHPTQTIEIFLAMFLCHLVRWPSVDNSDIQVKFYADRSRGTPSSHKRVSQI